MLTVFDHDHDRCSPSMATSNQSPTPPSAFNRTRPASRRTASSYDIRLYETRPIQHHHRSTSSSALPFTRTHAFTHPVSSVTPPPPNTGDPRFSRFFSTVLGSPFLTTSEHLPQIEMDTVGSSAHQMHAMDARPSSPAPTSDFSIIDVDDDAETQPVIPGSYPSNHSRFLSSSMANLSFSGGRPIYASANNANWNTPNRHHTPPQTSTSFKSLIPRLWEALSSPSRSILGFSSSGNVNAISPSSSRSSSRTASPSASPRRQANQSWYTNNGTMSGRNSPVYWNTGPSHKSKGKSKTSGLFSPRSGSRGDLKDNINYLELPPLDGEEGELIDDEACFIDSRAIRGIGECILAIVDMLAINT